MAENNLNDLMSGGGFAALLQNPEIAAKLPKIMEALAPVMAEMRGEKSADTPPETEPQEKSQETAAFSSAEGSPEALLGKLLGGAAKPRESSARRIALLRALEPYLSKDRREAMEYICKVSGLLDLLSEVM